MKTIFTLLAFTLITLSAMAQQGQTDLSVTYSFRCNLDFPVRPDLNRSFKAQICNSQHCFIDGQLIENDKLIYHFDILTQAAGSDMHQAEFNFLQKGDFFPRRLSLKLEGMPQKRGSCKKYSFNNISVNASCNMCAVAVQESGPPCKEGEIQHCGDGSCYCSPPQEEPNRG